MSEEFPSHSLKLRIEAVKGHAITQNLEIPQLLDVQAMLLHLDSHECQNRLGTPCRYRYLPDLPDLPHRILSPIYLKNHEVVFPKTRNEVRGVGSENPALRASPERNIFNS